MILRRSRALSSFLLAVSCAGVTGAVWSTPAHAAGLDIRETWARELPGSPILNSSPAVGTVDGGGPVALVGGGSSVYALHLTNGSDAAGWPRRSSNGSPIDSSPSTAGSNVFVGVGDTAQPTNGGYQFFTPGGNFLRTVPQIVGGSTPSGVQGGLVVGVLQGQDSVYAGTLGQYGNAYNINGFQLSGFPYFQADTNFGTSAMADLYRNGQTEIVEGGASTAGLAYGTQYVNGGHIRVINQYGTQLCNFNLGQPVNSSPAVGEFLSNHAIGIVTGTGNTYYPGQPGADQVVGFNTSCQPQWATTLDNPTDGSPAIVNALGNGALQVAETTHSNDNTVGTTYLLDGTNGRVLWSHPILGGAVGGPVSVDLGGGYQDIVVTGTQGLQILDGHNGSVIWQVAQSNLAIPAMQNSALVTDDPNGTIGITIAGYNIQPFDGEVVHFEIFGSNGRAVTEAGSWPEFHHDPQLSGDAGTAPVNVQIPCRPPAGPFGYIEAGSDGSVYHFGNLPNCGSLAGYGLDQPVVTAAETPDGGGYWLVASDGGVFSFGDAKFHGSTGGVHLVKPIVTMARTADGGGYWLVASDGGVFSFGDAHFHGSLGGVRLDQPIVAMAATPDGDGYWLFARDGGVFAFGDAHFCGSLGGVHLNAPIVGAASAPDGNGYWMVASDGGVFSFRDAHFHGSTGGVHLDRPVVGMAATPDGGGYWLVASDGGIFNYGDAGFYGSTGGSSLPAPVVGAATAA